MKKLLCIIISLNILQAVLAAVPTEEGLLKNLNNPAPNGNMVTIKMAAQNDFYKLVFYIEKNGVIGLVQVTYSDSQMQNSQIKNVKFFPDFAKVLSLETSPEKSLFYGAMMMLATNRPIGMEIFLNKNGVKVAKNRELMNEEKIALLKSYKSYLANSKGKGESDSPLNPSNPEERTKAISLFKSNTYTRSRNISLIKEGSDFYWKADWQSVQGIFSNEERRLKRFDYKNQEGELPKNIEVKNDKGLSVKVQILGEEVSFKKDKDFEDFKKKISNKKERGDTPSFLY